MGLDECRLKVWVGLIEFKLTHSYWCTTSSPTSLKPILSHDHQVFLLFLKLIAIIVHWHVVSFVYLFVFNWHHHLFLFMLRFELLLTELFFFLLNALCYHENNLCNYDFFFVTLTIHLCVINHEKKTLQNCNPKVLHHENKMGKRIPYLPINNQVTLAYVMTPIFLPTYMTYYL